MAYGENRPGRKICFQVSLEPAKYETLKQLSATTHVAMAVLVRGAIDSFLCKNTAAKKLPKF